ncbi:hypothetical protein [Gloeobacter kilaueensis]|uniref:Uncharacterized protein n=1 Tax=Gloeobacter kilaueensis (strain ATCC BAA-2537 / CCAP 1431/1 / ULC 316 / JS1) TaxID=1183438 RepID=U5QMJ7_GLOK1|nr:hypothetical protein [Gloeobacter kilaueensis]AGY60151.1 hypothetical protein GKIL_3905 [Gloeobacter kilaueensis JS1]
MTKRGLWAVLVLGGLVLPAGSVLAQDTRPLPGGKQTVTQGLNGWKEYDGPNGKKIYEDPEGRKYDKAPKNFNKPFKGTFSKSDGKYSRTPRP